MAAEYKLICVFAEEAVAAAKGNRGKMHAQSGHAYLHAFWDAERRFPEAARGYRDSLTQSAYKIALIGPQAVFPLLESRYASTVGFTLVKDRGLTVFEGPTITAVGIGPILLEGRFAEDLNLRPFV